MARVRKFNAPTGPRRKARRKVIRRYKRRMPIPQGVKSSLNIPRLQKFRYVQNFEINPGAGTIAVHNWSANDLNQPNKTTSGHRPMRFDAIKTFYNHYVVIGSKITVTKVSTGAGAQTTIVWGIFMNDSVISPTSFSQMVEQGRSRYRVTNTSNNQTGQSLSKGYSAKKFFNVTNISDNFDRLGADVASSPSEGAIFSVWAQALDLSTDLPAEQYLCVIDYIAMFSEPKDIATAP